MNDTACPATRAGIELRHVADELLVHDPAGASVHVLNATAGNVLELCDGTRTLGDIAAAVRAGVNDPHAPVERDVDRIVGEFVRLGLLDLRERA